MSCQVKQSSVQVKRLSLGVVSSCFWEVHDIRRECAEHIENQLRQWGGSAESTALSQLGCSPAPAENVSDNTHMKQNSKKVFSSKCQDTSLHELEERIKAEFSVLDPTPDQYTIAFTPTKVWCCNFCEFKSCFRHTFASHIAFHTGKRLQCFYCDFSTKYRNCFRSHMIIHVPQLGGMYTCPHCDFSCCSTVTIADHINNHNTADKAVCPHCPYTCRRTHADKLLHAHVRTHAKGKFACAYCPLITATRNSALAHRKRHPSGGRYSCEECDFTTTLKTKHRSHVKIHNDIKKMIQRILEERKQGYV